MLSKSLEFGCVE